MRAYEAQQPRDGAAGVPAGAGAPVFLEGGAARWTRPADDPDADARQANADIATAIEALRVARAAVLSAMFAAVDGPASMGETIAAIDGLIARATGWTGTPLTAGGTQVDGSRTPRRAGVAASGTAGGPQLLTRREMDVLDGLGRGIPPAAIAQELGISVETCRAYIKSLRRKLHARTQLEAVVIAGRLGLLPVRQ